jgi:selenocysteine-specific elongation factor
MQVIATAGHVDHGKSTLVRALTGMEPDRWAEERRRGMTIDLGFAWTTLASGAEVAFVDVPGHERFVTTMLAGVGPVPAVLLVVAADEGWMPQSAEHVDALTALGVRHGLLVVTRSDLLDPELARDDARAHLMGTPLAEIPTVCVSAATGQNMDALRVALDDLVAVLPVPDLHADVRLWVDRSFTIRGAGTVVTGTLPAGRLRVDDGLELMSADGTARRVTVRGLQSLGAQREGVTGVARVAVNLRGVPREAVARGDVLLTPGAWLPTRELDVRLAGVRSSAPDPTAPDPTGLPEQLTLHVGSAAVEARVRPLGADVVRLRLRQPVPLRIGDRAVLRDPGRRRVAAGLTVLDVAPPPLRRRGAPPSSSACTGRTPQVSCAGADTPGGPT